ncbi:MAG: Ig-like domain-containing protein, partial [Halioglobus sp.]|nr:Ig-like domain-containing protein [Halioglobus sp.]
ATLEITATVNAGGDYTHTAGISGLNVSDPVPGNNSDSVATVPNNPPMALDDLAGADPDVPTNIDVLANDSDADGDALTITAVSVPGNGTATIDTMGTPNPADDEITYTANTGFAGTDTFTYTVQDPSGDSDTATVSVTVPLASADVSLAVSVDDPAPSVGDTLTFTVQVDNAGPDAATVQVTSPLPDGYSYVGDTGGGAYNSATGEWMVGPVGAGMSATLEITATVNAGGDYAVTATISGLNALDPDPGDNQSSFLPTASPVPQAIPLIGWPWLLLLSAGMMLLARRRL